MTPGHRWNSFSYCCESASIPVKEQATDFSELPREWVFDTQWADFQRIIPLMPLCVFQAHRQWAHSGWQKYSAVQSSDAGGSATWASGRHEARKDVQQQKLLLDRVLVAMKT